MDTLRIAMVGTRGVPARYGGFETAVEEVGRRLADRGVAPATVVRALRRSDADEWQAVRARNHDWLRPWDATVPPGAAPRPSSYKVVTRSLLQQARPGVRGRPSARG